MKIIRTFFLAVIALLAVGLSQAQFTVGSGAQAPAVGSPNSAMPAGKFYVNNATIPQKRAGLSREIIGVNPEAISYYPTFGNNGQWRIGCLFSHMSFDDPIVYPGRAGMTHLHAFFGNTQTRATSDLSTFVTTGTSTCTGGIANRTGYWSSVFVYSCPAGSTNGCTRARDGEVQIPPDGNFYYKTNASFTNGQWFPVGHRMIVGNSSATAPNDTEVVRIECYVQGSQIANQKALFTSAEGVAAVANYRAANGAGTLPGATGCDEINMLMGFPECSNGLLDSPDHKSHMKYADSVNGCTDPAFPTLFPQMTVNMHTYVNNADLDFLRLSSDPPASSGQRAGYTQHTDRVEGFSRNPNFAGSGRALLDIALDTCLGRGRTNMTSTDCHNHGLGDLFLNGGNWRLDR